MLTSVRGVSTRRRAAVRPGLRPGLEALDERCLLSLVTLTAATQADARTVWLDYTIAPSTPPGSLNVNVYRSTAAQLGSADQISIGSVTLSGADVTPGSHAHVPLVLGKRSPGVDALALDPTHHFVIAGATGPDGLTSSASYQTFTIGLVTHGFDSSDTAPAWVAQMASRLQALGYDQTFAFDWATASHTLQSGEGVQAGKNAAKMIETFIQGTNTQGQPNVPAGAVIDLHLIGHSRGSVVITQAMNSLQADLTSIPQARGGYWELTYLDPHPSNGINVAPFSATSQVLIDAANALQLIYQDPYPLFVPPQVALAQVYYENTPVSMIEPFSEEGQLNPWGITYPVGIQATPGATTEFQTLNLSTPGMSHSSVYMWYMANVVPTLATANPFVIGPIDAPIDAQGYQLTGDSNSVGFFRLAYFSDLDPNRSASDFNTTINWGDQTGTTPGVVVGDPDLGYFVLAFHYYQNAGQYQYSVTIQHPGGSSATASGTVNVTPAATLSGASAGQAPVVTLTQAGSGQVLSQLTPFGPQVRGGVRVAYADVNGDGTRDIIAAPGPGAAGQVRVFDGKDQHLIRAFSPFGRGYRGGLTVAGGNVGVDGKAEIAVADASGNIRLFSGADGSLLGDVHVRPSFLRNGTGLSIEDRDHDGYGDVIISKPGGMVRKLYSGHSLAEQRASSFLALTHDRRGAGTLVPSSFLSGALPFLRGRKPRR